MWNVAVICGHCTGLCDGVVNKFISDRCHMSFSLTLGSDHEIRIRRKLWSDTITFFLFCIAKPFNKAVCNSLLKVESVVLILASRPKMITSFF